MSEVLHYPIDTTGKGDPRSIADYLELLAVMSQDFAMSLDIEATLERALDRIMDYLQAEGASIFLLENDNTELVCRVCVGPVDITGIRLGISEGIVGRTVRDNRSQMVRDVRRDPNFASVVDEKTGFVTRSILCAPLGVKDQRLGAIELVNKHAGDGLFSDRDRHLLEALAASAALAIKNAQMAADLLKQERLRREIELAGEIQRGLLPARRKPPFPISGINIPARHVSGDFFDYFELPDGRIAFNIGDVAGKGINAALMMAKVSSLFHCLGKTVHEPGALMAKLDAEVAETSMRGMFVTMVGGIYDPKTRRVALANAGHEPPLLYHREGGFREFPAKAPPLGLPRSLEVGAAFPEEDIALDGGSLYLFTDGLTEGIGGDGGPIGIEGVRSLIARYAPEPTSQALEAIVGHLDRAGDLKDDVTILCIGGAGRGSPS